jgi:hypothetical protein
MKHNVFKLIKYRLLERRWEKILKDSTFGTWDMYVYWNDVDMNYNGSSAEECLVGFEYTADVSASKLDVNYDPMFGPIHSCDTLSKWVDCNCKDKVRWVWNSRFIRRMDFSIPHRFPKKSEALTVGFKNEKDLVWFSLKWH